MKNEQYLESEISVRFHLDLHGDIDTSLRCDLDLHAMQATIDKAKALFLKAASDCVLPDDDDRCVRVLNFSLRCYVLTDNPELLSTAIELEATECPSQGDDLGDICSALINKVRPQFLQSLERQEIQLS